LFPVELNGYNKPYSAIKTSQTSVPKVQLNNNFNLDGKKFVQNKHVKYHKMPEIRNIDGFVVNVHDPINFDIDFKFTENGIAHKYCHVISNIYTYKDLTSNFKLSSSCDSEADTSYAIENLMNEKIVGLETGIAYRCRLRGIAIQQHPSHKWRSNQLKLEIINLIDRTDGWITCNLSDIDVYKRLLVDITINTSNGAIDLCEYLLNRMKNEEFPIFIPYQIQNSTSFTSNL
jgi:hypothetical protein